MAKIISGEELREINDKKFKDFMDSHPYKFDDDQSALIIGSIDLGLTETQIEKFIIVKDGKPVYDVYQMREICEGLAQNLDVDKYMVLNKNGKPVYDSDQMHIIRLGLENNVDVDKYAVLNKDGMPVYDVDQMRVIYNGMAAGVDVDKYTIINEDGESVYDSRQMNCIYEGLEDGLVDVDKYARLNNEGKPVYSADQMIDFRRRFEENIFRKVVSSKKEVDVNKIIGKGFSIDEFAKYEESRKDLRKDLEG